MKFCTLCGSTFDERVDFCFRDGTPLVLRRTQPGEVLDSPEATKPILRDDLDAPDPGAWALDAPDPGATVPRAIEKVPAQEDTEVTEPLTDGPLWADEIGVARGVPDDFRGHIPGLEDDDDGFDFPDDDIEDIPFAPESRTTKPGGVLPKVLAAAVILVVVGGAAALLGGPGTSEDGAPVVAAVEPPAPSAAVAPPPAPRPPAAPVRVESPEPEPPGALAAATLSEEPPVVADAGATEAQVAAPVGPTDAEIAAESAADSARIAAQERQAAAAAAAEARAQAQAARQRAQNVPKARNDPAPSRIGPPPPKPAATAGGGGGLWGAASGGGEPAVSDGTVTVTSNPAGASVWVDGEKKGVTPLGLKLAPGYHTFKVGQDGFREASKRYSVQAGASVSIPFQLEASDSMVSVLLVGPADMQGARVYLRAKELGNIPVSTELQAGVHEFQVVGDRFYKVRREIRASADGKAVRIELSPN